MPHHLHASELKLHRREVREALAHGPALGAALGGLATVVAAGALHVLPDLLVLVLVKEGIGGPAVDHCAPEAGDHGAIDRDHLQVHPVAAADLVGVPDLAGVVCLVGAAYGEAPALLREADGEDPAVHVARVPEEVVQQGRLALDAEDAVGLLRVEQLVLVLVAAHRRADRGIVLYRVTQADDVLEPVPGDGRAFQVGLPVGAVARRAAAAARRLPGAAFRPARDPLRGPALRDVEEGVDVLAAVRAALAREGEQPAPGIQDHRHPLGRRAYCQVDVVVGVRRDIAVQPRRLQLEHWVVHAAAHAGNVDQ
mmetsp:Transcript_52355/g.139416  ORF Transcript_52355/g.139416 Transcript_52355/m.139416 type:complete len:310 (+) Transcript_52355:319-1248(+)